MYVIIEIIIVTMCSCEFYGEEQVDRLEERDNNEKLKYI